MNSSSTQTLSPIPPEADGHALAPIDDSTEPDYSRLIEDEAFADYLNKIADYATGVSNSQANWERRRKSVKLRKYVCGEYYGIFDKSRGWVSAKEEGDGIYYAPETATFIAKLVAQLVKTKPQKKCEPRNPERVDKREAARVAEKLLQLDDDQDFTPKRQQREWKWNLLTAGETYRITYFDQKKPGKGVDEDVFEPKMIEGGDVASYCPLCNSTAMDESGKCVQCGNPQMDEFQALGTTITIKKGSKFKQIGDVDYDVPDALEMTVIGETDSIAESLIVMRDRMIPRCVLEDALGEYDLPDTGTPDALHYKNLFDPKENDNGVKEFESLHYQEFWIAPAVYTSYKFPNNTPTQGGQQIPAGTKAKDIFPNGLYFSRIKKKICTLFPQGAGEVLSHTVNSVGEGFHGQGEWDLIELQDQATEAKSMKMNSMLLDSTQPLMMRDGYVDAENFENKFGLIVPISQDYPLEQDLPNLMGRVPAGRPPTEAYQLGPEIKAEMQDSVGAFSTQSDAPDIKAMGTATGIAAITEQTLGRRAPALALYAQMEVDQAYQKLEMRQKYWCKKMYDPVARDLGGNAVKWFMECNIRQDINISVVPNSWMPRTETQKQTGMQTFLQIAGNIIAAKGNPKMMDEILRKSNELFGGGLNFNDFETESVEAQLRLDKLREVGAFVENQFGEFIYDPTGNISTEALMLAYSQTAEMLRVVHMQTDEADIFYNLPIDIMLDQHGEFEEAYSDWLKTAEGRAASVFIRTLVRQLADYHMQAEAYRTLKLKQYANVTLLPDLEAGLAENEASARQDMALGAEQKEQDLLYQGIAAATMPQPEAGAK